MPSSEGNDGRAVVVVTFAKSSGERVDVSFENETAGGSTVVIVVAGILSSMSKSSPVSLVLSGPGVSNSAAVGGGALVLGDSSMTVIFPGDNVEMPSVVKVGVIGVVVPSLEIGVDVFLKSSDEMVNKGTH